MISNFSIRSLRIIRRGATSAVIALLRLLKYVLQLLRLRVRSIQPRRCRRPDAVSKPQLREPTLSCKSRTPTLPSSNEFCAASAVPILPASQTASSSIHTPEVSFSQASTCIPFICIFFFQNIHTSVMVNDASLLSAPFFVQVVPRGFGG